ncbi:MAG: hypothetical protein IJ169_06695 [Paludibacteraceae bacterium]|nr:hypothetical protein [Paludibacteraceae bacterium]
MTHAKQIILRTFLISLSMGFLFYSCRTTNDYYDNGKGMKNLILENHLQQYSDFQTYGIIHNDILDSVLTLYEQFIADSTTHNMGYEDYASSLIDLCIDTYARNYGYSPFDETYFSYTSASDFLNSYVNNLRLERFHLLFCMGRNIYYYIQLFEPNVPSLYTYRTTI